VIDESGARRQMLVAENKRKKTIGIKENRDHDCDPWRGFFRPKSVSKDDGGSAQATSRQTLQARGVSARTRRIEGRLSASIKLAASRVCVKPEGSQSAVTCFSGFRPAVGKDRGPAKQLAGRPLGRRIDPFRTCPNIWSGTPVVAPESAPPPRLCRPSTRAGLLTDGRRPASALRGVARRDRGKGKGKRNPDLYQRAAAESWIMAG